MKIAHYLHPSFGEGGITTLATKLIKFQGKLGVEGVVFQYPPECPKDCDVIITHGQMGWFEPKPSKATKTVHMLHGSCLDRIFAMRSWLSVMSWTCFGREWRSAMVADGVITDSRAPLLERATWGKKFEAIIPAGFENPDEVKSSSIKLDADQFLVLFVGRHDDPVKNYALAKKIMSNFKQDDSIRFLAVPKDTGFLNELELKYLYKHGGLLLITSFAEGGPLVALEALSEGLPICSTDVGYVAKVIDGKCGKIFSQVEQAVTFIKQISANKKLRQEMGMAALIKSQDYSWDKYAKKVLEYIRTL